ncbi:hypothetical protein ABID25_006521 [Mesorhizobium abyssinicae]
MLRRKERDQLELFLTGSLRQLVPDDHILARVDRVLDLDWLRKEVADLYCADNGRPGIDPEVAVRLMLAGFLLGIVHDRRLMREAQVNVAIRWFTMIARQHQSSSAAWRLNPGTSAATSQLALLIPMTATDRVILFESGKGPELRQKLRHGFAFLNSWFEQRRKMPHPRPARHTASNS